MVDPIRDLFYLSSAVPDRGTGAEAAAVLGELEDAFRSRARTPRLEFIEDLSPELPAVLDERGWQRTERIPVLTCDHDGLRVPAAPAGLEVATPPPERARDFLMVQRIAFEDDGPITDDELERWHSRAERSVRVVAIRDGVLVGTAIAVGPVEGVVEIVGVATLPEHRRQGIAGVLTAVATAQAFERGGELAWLSAADDAAARIYERAGYARVATQVGYNAAA
jgi:ribosomal protein S18 acetylase RimI-like enzyme